MLKKAFLWGAIAVLAYAGLGFLAAPALIKRAVQDRGGDALGRTVTVGDIRVNPFLLTATLGDVAVAGLPGAPPVLTLAEVHADISSASLIRRGVVLSELRIVSPVLRVARTAPNRYDVSDILERVLSGPKKETPRLLLEHLEVRDGSIDFDDRPEQAKHSVRELTLAVPFVSSLPDLADQFVEPTFSAAVNGARVNLSGRVKPFSDTRETSLEVQLSGVELARYVEYLPFPLGVRLESGTLEGKVKVGFREAQQKTAAFGLAGQLVLHQLELREASGQPLLAVPRTQVSIASLDLLGRSLTVDKVRLEGARAHVRRGGDGRLNLASFGSPAEPADGPSRAKFMFELRSAEVVQGELSFADQAVSPAFNKALDKVTLTATNLTNQEGKTGQVDLSFDTRAGERATATATVALSPLSLEGSFEAAGLSVPVYAPYYAASLPVVVESATARSSGKFRVAPGDHAALRLTDLVLALADVRVRQGDREFIHLAALEAEGGEVDLAGRSVTLRSLAARDGTVSVSRDASGVLSVGRLAPPEKATPAAGPEWTVAVAKATTSGVALAWEDAAAPSPVKLSLGPIDLSAENLSSRAGSASKLNATLSVDGKGSLSVAGPLQLMPLKATLELQAKGLPVGAFHPYFADVARIAIAGGSASARGTLSAAEGSFSYRGSLELADVAITNSVSGERLLEWASLGLNGVQVASEPFSLRAAEVVLAGFYAGLVVLPEGRLSLQQVLSPDEKLAAVAKKPEVEKAAPARAPPDIAIDRFILKDGTVDFSDLYVRPNFSAHLTQVGGQVLGLSADPGSQAKVDVTARIEQTAPVTISGTVNPLAEPISLDLTASVRGYDLNLLSTYSAKYIGYGIEKGKLSLDLRYRVRDRKLEAQNRIFLDQLTFGRQVESPNALQLPVLLAVKLLQNSRGEIDLNVPVSGSLDDPQFSMGEIVVKAIGNVFLRLVSAPFAFLGSLFGGGGGAEQEELSWVGFEPGREDITPEADKKMETIAKALSDRPQLSLEIAARIAPAADSDGLKRKLLESRLVPAPRGAAPARIPAADYPKLLRQMYERENPPVPGGREPTAEEIEKLLLAEITVAPEHLRDLAIRRGVAVQTRLAAKGISGERMFLVSPAGEDAETRKNAPESRVDLYLK